MARPWAASDAADDESGIVRLFDAADNLVAEMPVTDARELGQELLDVASYVEEN